MIEPIERMLTDLEHGKLTRRQFAVSIATLAAGSLAAPGALAAPLPPAGFPAVSLNHITVSVPDLHRTSKFYQEFFGMPLRQESASTHILGVGKSFFPIPSITLTSGSRTLTPMQFARLTDLNLKFSGTSQESFKFTDPDGFLVQVNGPDSVSHV
jgi:glyoxalase/bleomycin resistance protein/dioxygenase superfamily protein